MITSKQNPLIKEIRSLADKKFRDLLNVYVVEGIKSVKEAIELNLPIKIILATDKYSNELCARGVEIETVSEELYKHVSQEVTPQGALAVIFKPENKLVNANGSCILLDGVADPGNVGAIIRTAVASGYEYVYMTDDCADAFSPKSVRASMGGVFRAKIIRGALSDILSVMDKPIVVADMKGENVFLSRPSGEFCLVIGNEGKGVCNTLREKASKTVSIPMENGMESLNAAVSASILMYNLKY